MSAESMHRKAVSFKAQMEAFAKSHPAESSSNDGFTKFRADLLSNELTNILEFMHTEVPFWGFCPSPILSCSTSLFLLVGKVPLLSPQEAQAPEQLHPLQDVDTTDDMDILVIGLIRLPVCPLFLGSM